MKKMYIILLKNNYLLFSDKKPKKKGNYTHEVRLFESSSKTSCETIHDWVSAEYDHKSINEVANWE